MGRILLTVALAVFLASVAGIYFGLFTATTPDPVDSPTSGAVAVAPDKLGDWLIKQPAKEIRDWKPRPVQGMDPIVISGILMEIDKVDVPSTIAGAVLYIGDGVPEGTTQVAGIAPFMHDHYQQASVVQDAHKVFKFYRPLKRGGEVRNDQLVAEIDYARAINAYLQHKSLLEKSEAELTVSKAMDKAATELWTITNVTGSSIKEKIEANVTRIRTSIDVVKAEKEVEKEILEVINAKNLLAYHEIRFKLPVHRAFVSKIYHDTTEAVKENEPVLQIYSADRLMAEALVETQYAQRLAAARVATIEPAIDQDPWRMFEGHRGNAPITGVAFITVGNVLHVVSASQDGFLKMWRQGAKGAVASINHREPIKALACSPRGAAQPLCVTGTADGKIHLWNLDPDNSPLPTPARVVAEPIDGHRDAVTALTFSPDGTMFVSGAADGSIKLWSAQDGKLIYEFDPAHGVDNPHQGAITALTFTPQSRLISASRDNTLRVWNLKEKGAYLEGQPITSRSGAVNQLGVSQDGNWMLFDQGKSLQIMTVPDGNTIDTLKSPAGAVPFETLALFSPDASLILTAGAPEGKLHLWRAPSEDSRGYEVRQFLTDQRSPVTCAAFGPAPSAPGEVAFAASGSKDGNVYLWPLPSKKDVESHRIPNVPVTVFIRNAEAGSRQFRLGVEVDNRSGRLAPGRPVTIVIE